MRHLLPTRQGNGKSKGLRYVSLGCLLLAIPLIANCGEVSRLDRILENKKLVVVTRNAPTTYYEGHDGLAGFEYELVSAFATHLGVEVEFVIEDNLAKILAMVARGEVDIAAAGVTRTAQRKNGFLFSEPYQYVTQQVVCRRGGARPKQPADLVGVKLAVPAMTSYVERLNTLKKTIPQLAWDIAYDHDTESFLEQVWAEKLDCTIGDSNIVAIKRRYLPELTVRFAITGPESLGWMMPRSAHALRDKANNWLATFRTDGELARLLNKYYGFIDVFDYVDTRIFKRKVKRVLPRYRKLFEAAAKKNNFDWTLLAAQAYQESHWNRRARSPTGVRGIMMLTLTTARELGIKSRLNAEESIHGGARYLARLRDRLPDNVEEPDRTWLALAAYNVGMGHIYDARRLAEQQGKNQDRWHDLKEVLPLLSQKKYYRKLNYGYARGREPVRYVQRIRDYQDMLLQELKEN